MACRLIWAPSARLDLKEIASYVAEFRPITSTRLIRAIFRRVERLAEFPQAGRIVPEFGEPSIREIVCRPFRIVYRVMPDEGVVEITRLWHAARGTPQIEDTR